MEIKKIPAAVIKPAAYNPRKELKPGDEIYEKLKKSIQEFGYVEPIIWNQRTGNIVGGHQRFTVLVELGYTEIDCIVLDLDDQKEKALNIAMNKITSVFDKNKLDALLRELSGDIEISFTGINDQYIENLFSADALAKEIDGEQEYSPAGINIESIKASICGYIDRLHEKDPDRLRKSFMVIVPLNRGNTDSCMILCDSKCADAAQELRRQHDAGESSPLECLFEALL